MHHRPSPILLALALGASLAACAGDPTSPAGDSSRPSLAATSQGLAGDRLATVEWGGRYPALWIGNGEGTARSRVHLVNVHDRIAGNYPQALVPIGDETIIGMRWPKWSPDGQRLAVAVAGGFDQGEVLVMNADGHEIRVASPNSQSIMSDVEWSPDGRAVAYVMSTSFNGRLPDLFVTDLVKDEVHRVTTRGGFGPWDQFRFDASGAGVRYTEYAGWARDGVTRTFNLVHADLAGNILGVERVLNGEPTALSRDGRTALVTRDIDAYTRALVRVGPGDKDEVTLAVGDVQWARFLEGDGEILLAEHQPWTDPYSTPPMRFSLIGLDGRVRRVLPTSDAAEVANLLHGRK